LLYAKDAPNWNGYPWVSGGNIQGTKEQRGNLTQLKKAGLIKTQVDDEDGPYVVFTETGMALAKEHGIDLYIFQNKLGGQKHEMLRM
jgi:hypothetical protein